MGSLPLRLHSVSSRPLDSLKHVSRPVRSGFGATVYTAGIGGVVMALEVSQVSAVVGYSIVFLGVATAPIHTPHLAERVGRKPVYLVSLFIFSLFVLGGGYAKTFSGVLATRFFAGFFGGPSLVLIEGTFADMWSARTTVTYYSFLTLASYLGAAFGMHSSFSPSHRRWQG